MQLTNELQQHYFIKQDEIKNKLEHFKNINQNKYFYEFCFCLLTPQSKAENAIIVQDILELNDFENKFFSPVEILSNKTHYIRFHNQKSKRLLWAKENFTLIKKIINSDDEPFNKREQLVNLVNGMGMKEASHFLRNIGQFGLTILDRHILNTLKLCNVFEEIPKINNKKNYLIIENLFQEFSKKINISIDELDLLFFSYQNGKILK